MFHFADEPPVSKCHFKHNRFGEIQDLVARLSLLHSSFPKRKFSETMEHFHEIAEDLSNVRFILAKLQCQTLEVWEFL